jgi:hypothetical protein
MRIFISWSGDKSQAVARALGDWLPSVMHGVDPFVSSTNIDGGANWRAEVSANIAAADFGVLCVTRENRLAPWLNFEAGALANSMVERRVVPFAVDLAPVDVGDPLAQLFGLQANETGARALVESINHARPAEQQLTDRRLGESFIRWWPDLESTLVVIEQTFAGTGADTQSERELLRDAVAVMRSLMPDPTPPGKPNEKDAPQPTRDDAESRFPYAAVAQISELVAKDATSWSMTPWLTEPQSLYIQTVEAISPEVAEEVKKLGAAADLRVIFSYLRETP